MKRAIKWSEPPVTPLYDADGVTEAGAGMTRAQFRGGKWVQVPCDDAELVYQTLHLRALHEAQKSWSEAERNWYNGVTHVT